MTTPTEAKATATVTAALEGTAEAFKDSAENIGEFVAFVSLAMFANGVRIALADPKVGKELSIAAEMLVRGEPFTDNEPLIALLINQYKTFETEAPSSGID